MIEMDVWNKVESNLAAVKAAGAREAGEILPPEYRSAPSREQQLQEYQREERIRLRATAWKRR
jgi:hypothetical protein